MSWNTDHERWIDAIKRLLLLLGRDRKEDIQTNYRGTNDIRLQLVIIFIIN